MIHSCLGVFLCHNWHMTTIISHYYRNLLPGSTGAPKEKKSKPLSCQAWEITELHYHNCRHTGKIMQTTNKHFDYSLCCAVEIRSSMLWCIMNADLEEHFHKKICKISETFGVMLPENGYTVFQISTLNHSLPDSLWPLRWCNCPGPKENLGGRNWLASVYSLSSPLYPLKGDKPLLQLLSSSNWMIDFLVFHLVRCFYDASQLSCIWFIECSSSQRTSVGGW